MHSKDNRLLAMAIALSIHSHNGGNNEKSPNSEEEEAMEEISGMSEEGGFTRSSEISSAPKLPGMLIKKPGTSRVYVVWWWRPDNWAKLRGTLRMACCLGGCEEVASNVSIYTPFRYNKMFRGR